MSLQSRVADGGEAPRGDNARDDARDTLVLVGAITMRASGPA